MQHNSPLSKQMAGQNRAKLLEIIIYMSTFFPWNAQANESKFDKIELHNYSTFHMQTGAPRFLVKKI